LIKAGSAREALEHLLKEDIAIVLSDVCMPELDGFELARMIGNHPRFQHTAIIFVSAVALTDPDRVKLTTCLCQSSPSFCWPRYGYLPTLPEDPAARTP
jgi:CheY-like chemotaxis protein